MPLKNITGAHHLETNQWPYIFEAMLKHAF